MRWTYLDGAVTCVRDSQFNTFPTLIEDNAVGMRDDGAWDLLWSVFGHVDGREGIWPWEGQKGAIQGCSNIPRLAANRVVNCYQEDTSTQIVRSTARDGKGHSPVDKCALNLNFVDECRNPWKDMSAAEERLAVLHQVGNRVYAIANAFLENRGNQGDCFRLIKAEAPCEPFLGEEACLRVGRLHV